MPYSCRPTWVDVDLAALLHNLNQAASFCVEGQRILAVVKADAYGHGAVHVTQTLQTAGIQDLRSQPWRKLWTFAGPEFSIGC